MQKRFGAYKAIDGLYKCGRDKYDLFYGYFPSETQGGSYNLHKRYDFCPDSRTIREDITDALNAITQERILSGFVWNGIHVWLSDTQQLNFQKVENGHFDFPVRLKLGEDPHGNALYHEFPTMEDFKAFSCSASRHVMECIAEGYRMKDLIQEADFTLKETF